MIKKSIRSGLKRSAQLYKVILFFWIINLLIAILFLQPLGNAFRNFFENRPAAEILAGHNLSLYLSEFLHYSRHALHAAMRSILLGNIFYILMSIFFSGGLIFYFISEGQVNSGEFFSQSLKFSGRMFRAALLWLALFLLQLLVGIFIFIIIFKSISRSSPESTYYFAFFTWLSFMALLFLLILLLTDLTRIHLVQTDEGSVLRSFKAAVKTFLNSPFRFIITQFIIFIFAFCLTVIYFSFQKIFPDTRLSGIFFAFLFLQIFVMLQIWIKISRFGALAKLTGMISRSESI